MAQTNALRQSSFTNYWVSRMLSSISFHMLAVAIGWEMYAITQNAFDLGYVGLAQFLPMVFLTLIVGQVADRFDRRRIILICQLSEAVIAGIFLAGVIGGWLTREAILVLSALLGAARSFEGPASSALLPQLMPKEALQQAISWTTSVGQTSMIVGPALGGLLYSLGGQVVYGTAAAALVVGSVMMLFIRVREAAVRRPEPVTVRSLLAGAVFVYRRPIIFGTISLDLFAVLLGGATALLPIFASDVLHTGPWGLGLMRTAPAVGALVMSIWLGFFPLKRRAGPYLFAALAVFGLATMLFAVSKSLTLSLVALFLTGASDVVSVVIRSSLVQLQTPDEMRGRVNAVNSLFIGTSNQLGEFESGVMAGFFGVVPAAFIGGIGTLAVAGIWMALFPSLRRMKSLEG